MYNEIFFNDVLSDEEFVWWSEIRNSLFLAACVQVGQTLHMTSTWEVVLHRELWSRGRPAAITMTLSLITSSTTTRRLTSQTCSPKEREYLQAMTLPKSVWIRGLTIRLVSRLATRLGLANAVHSLKSVWRLSRSRIKIRRTCAPLVEGRTSLSSHGRYVLHCIDDQCSWSVFVTHGTVMMFVCNDNNNNNNNNKNNQLIMVSSNWLCKNP